MSRLLDYEKSLDQQMREIRQGKDTRSLTKLLPKQETYTYSKKQKEEKAKTNNISFHALELYRKLNGLKGLEKFILKASLLKGKSNKEKMVLCNKYKVSIVIVNRAINSPKEMIKKFKETKSTMKLRGIKI